MILSFGHDKKFQASLCDRTVVSTKRSKTVSPRVDGEGAEEDDCGAGHHRQEGGEQGRAGEDTRDILITQAPAMPDYSVSFEYLC